MIETAPDSPVDVGRAIRALDELGITGELVLVIGVCERWPALPGRVAVVCVGPAVHSPPAGVVHAGQPASLGDVLELQSARRRAHRVPHVDPDPRWTVPLPADPAERHLAESLGSLANGRAGSRAALEENDPGGAPLLLIAGVYDREDRLLPGPVWTAVDLPVGAGAPVRILDLRSGLLARQPAPGTPVRSLRLVSATEPHCLAMRCEVAGEWAGPATALRIPPVTPAATFSAERRAGVEVAVTGDQAGATIAVAAQDSVSGNGGWSTLERLAAWASSGPDDPSPAEVAREHLEALHKSGFDALLGAHRRAWAQMWRHAEVSIEGPPADEMAARFAVFHLLGAASGSGESAVGPRGLTGGAYAGHVFWDADVFVLPALAAIHPPAARSMLEYRVRRLPAARRAARSGGLDGARFPWESARDGTDVTPDWVRAPGGEAVPIATGRNELHIVADVAWAACRYADWSGDRAFVADGPGRDLILDTARFWAARIRTDRSGRAHIYGVMGPDEYHETVDDNAFTNVMARWNLRTAAGLLAGQGPGGAAEAARWRSLAGALVDGWDPRLRTFEQFAGYHGLERLMVADVARPPVAIDMVLGHDRVAGSQLIKQADVVMLHHMLEEEVPEGSLLPSLDFYLPRTAHGSSLSPAIHASLLARAGRTAEALAMFRLASRLDLDDITGTSGAGLHLATMGGLWQALAYGFLGMRVAGGTLTVAPHLPAEWSALAMRFDLAGAALEVRAGRGGVRVACDRPVRVRVGAGAPRVVGPPGARFTAI